MFISFIFLTFFFQVVVVGSGKSALDVALNASKNGVSSTLLFRQAHWGTPRMIAGSDFLFLCYFCIFIFFCFLTRRSS
jgi:heterodisulfide reductase subunit A-like polyferredoxin